MNKGQLIDALAERLGDKKTAAAAVTGLVDVVIRTVTKGDKVTITGFGVFEKRARAARMARNPRTGESVKVKKTTVPAFRPGTQFREVVRGTRKLPLAGASPNGALTSSAATTATTTSSSATAAAKPVKPVKPAKVIKPAKVVKGIKPAKETGAKATATGATATESPAKTPAKTAKNGAKATEAAKSFKTPEPVKDTKPSKAAKPGKAAKPIKAKANKVAAETAGTTNGA